MGKAGATGKTLLPEKRISIMFQKFRALRKDTQGAVAIVAALALPVLVLGIGGGVDYVRMLDMRTKLQTAADAALLATLSHRKLNPRASSASIEAYFQSRIREEFQRRFANKGMELTDISFNLQLTSDGAEMAQGEVQAKANTFFLRLAAINEMSFSVQSEARFSTSRTEVALVLDVTGSMAGAKIAELKRAATRFVNTIHDRVQNKDPEAFKVALVPFSQYVNVGKQYRNAPWIDVPPDGWRTGTIRNNCYYMRCVAYKWEWKELCWYTGSMDGNRKRVCRWRKVKRCTNYKRYKRNPCPSTRQIRRYISWEGCVGSRNYPSNLQPGVGSSQRIPAVMTYQRRITRPEMHYYGYTWRRNNCPRSPIMRLKNVKNEKAQIINQINGLRADGLTYIPAGLIWGWRVLGHGTPLGDGASDADVRRYNVQKIIVLMTDGENTRAPYHNSRSYAYKDHGSSDTRYANQITTELCNRIKQPNPATGRRNAEIITITFNVRNRTIKNIMQQCATIASFDVNSGQLEDVFDQIADKLVELHLSR